MNGVGQQEKGVSRSDFIKFAGALVGGGLILAACKNMSDYKEVGYEPRASFNTKEEGDVELLGVKENCPLDVMFPGDSEIKTVYLHDWRENGKEMYPLTIRVIKKDGVSVHRPKEFSPGNENYRAIGEVTNYNLIAITNKDFTIVQDIPMGGHETNDPTLSKIGGKLYALKVITGPQMENDLGMEKNLNPITEPENFNTGYAIFMEIKSGKPEDPISLQLVGFTSKIPEQTPSK